MADALQQERVVRGPQILDWRWMLVLMLAAVGLWAGRWIAKLPLTAMVNAGDRYLLGEIASAPSTTQTPKKRTPLPIPVKVAVSGLKPLPAGMVLAYFYDPSATVAQATQGVRSYLSKISGIIPSWYSVNGIGQISGSTDNAVLSLAKSHHLYTFALVSAASGASVLPTLLASPAHQMTAIRQIQALLDQYGYSGVNLDLEGIPPSDRTEFTVFVQRLARVLHQQGRYVTLSVPAETANQPNNSWTGAYSYRALGQAVDLLMIMAYDEHYPGSAPGPIAGAAWVRQVLNYAIGQVSPSKIILGIPGYGYNWTGPGNGTALTYNQAHSLQQQYAPQSGPQDHFQYIQNGVVHSVWFENAQGLLSKVDMAMGYELRGIALWRLGIEDPQLWGFLQ